MGWWSLEAWHKEVTRPSIIPKPLGMSLRYQVTKIFPPLPTLYIPEWVAGKLCIHFSQFLETTALCCKNIRQYYASIMPTVPDIALCSKLCRHNPIDPSQDKGGGGGSQAPPLDPPLQIYKYKEITGFDIHSRHLMVYIMFSNMWQHNFDRNCIILSWNKVAQISSIYLSWGVQPQAGTYRRSIILPKLDLIGSPVHLVSLRDKHWRPILDTTPLSTRPRASKFVYLQL